MNPWWFSWILWPPKYKTSWFWGKIRFSDGHIVGISGWEWIGNFEVVSFSFNYGLKSKHNYLSFHNREILSIKNFDALLFWAPKLTLSWLSLTMLYPICFHLNYSLFHVCVKIGTTISPACKVKSGVPQGCILSPLLFNIYLADLANSFSDPNVTIKFFADDCKAYIIYTTTLTATPKKHR
jgi:hypothetical protein